MKIHLIATPSPVFPPVSPDSHSSWKFHHSRPRAVLSKLDRIHHPKASHSPSMLSTRRKTCECFDLHKDLIPYGDSWTWQKEIVREKKALIDANEECPDTLIVLQHYPVYTMGTGSSEDYLNFDFKDSPYSIYRTERGGEVTYHGPGQLVLYPIINLRNHKMDLHWYIRALEEVVIRVLSSTFSINASRIDGLTGVWAGKKKLAAIGIRVSKWISFHGLALNVTTDLTPFNWIIPCGIRDRQVGNIKELQGEVYLQSGCQKSGLHLNEDSELIDITFKALIKEFSEVFQLDMHQKTVPALEFMKEGGRKRSFGEISTKL